jgi:hypothetical protein
VYFLMPISTVINKFVISIKNSTLSKHKVF